MCFVLLLWCASGRAGEVVLLSHGLVLRIGTTRLVFSCRCVFGTIGIANPLLPLTSGGLRFLYSPLQSCRQVAIRPQFLPLLYCKTEACGSISVRCYLLRPSDLRFSYRPLLTFIFMSGGFGSQYRPMHLLRSSGLRFPYHAPPVLFGVVLSSLMRFSWDLSSPHCRLIFLTPFIKSYFSSTSS